MVITNSWVHSSANYYSFNSKLYLMAPNISMKQIKVCFIKAL